MSESTKSGLTREDRLAIVENVVATLALEDLSPTADLKRWLAAFAEGDLSADDLERAVAAKYQTAASAARGSASIGD